MARCARLKADGGVYHVMMRGINRQNIFFDNHDRLKFLECLKGAVTYRQNLSGRDSGNFEVLAYALMSNHFHILVRVVSGELGEFVKKIASSYVLYFNKKYRRDGHLFKERFKSEPCETVDYCNTLFRYIHQNPIKAGLTIDLIGYRYTSWEEYAAPDSAAVKVCNVDFMLKRKSLSELERLVYEMLPENSKCIDIDKKRGQISDIALVERLRFKFGITSGIEVKTMPVVQRRALLLDLLDYGGSVCQIQRMTGVDKGYISRLKNKPTTK